MKKHLLTLFVFSFAISFFAQETEIVYLSGRDAASPVEWDFMVDKGMKANVPSKIPVPSNWELHGFGGYDYGHVKEKHDETGFYKYTFHADKDWAGKNVEIVFEGSMTDTEAKVNGQSAGPVHQGGFYRFSYDITNLIKSGEDNLLEVTVHKVSANQSVELAERKADFWVFGGIYRPVYLKISPKQHIERLAIDAKADGSFRVDVLCKGLEKKGTIEATIVGMDGKRTGEIFSSDIEPDMESVTLKTKVTGQKNWTAETPNLYFVDVVLKEGKKVLHTMREHFGFRTIEVRKGEGIFLNGKHIVLKGSDRHSFRPSQGRALSRKQCLNDVLLMKEMNMNAVRMSHYPPDKYFLDLCDEYGIYVLDELTGWQRPAYDTEVGKKLVKELVTRDENHPCVLFWDNGNEGGWNTGLDGEFAKYDPQNRNVLHPWELFGDIDTDHYEGFESVENKMKSGNIFMPTEHLHGLYDGGIGAGLDDMWRVMWGNPLNGGMFLWDFADEGVVRTDEACRIDADGNHAPDGIMGPHHEKEGSFFTVKEIWSPVYIETKKELTGDFDGTIEVENRYDFRNLNSCTFRWELIKYPAPGEVHKKSTVMSAGFMPGPDVPARTKGVLKPELPSGWKKADAFVLTAYDYNNDKLFTWKWKLVSNEEVVNKIVTNGGVMPEVEKEKDVYTVTAGDYSFSFCKKYGMLVDVKNGNWSIPFKNGPLFVSDKKAEAEPKKKVKIKVMDTEDGKVVDVKNHPDFDNLQWTVMKSGWLKLDYTYTMNDTVEYMGVSFDYPEQRMLGMTWLGKGPYREWRNRMKGGTVDVWYNAYNNFEAGTQWDYPEFPGYYSDFSWAVFDTKDGYITVMTDDDDLFLRVYAQKDGFEPRKAYMTWPEGDISFMNVIPAIGTKFHYAKNLGPEGEPVAAKGTYSGTLYFYFGLPE